ncbi:hypothetical protein GIB67_037469, partial [Kingdonia uniflora]
SSSLPSLMHKGRRDSLFSLGIILCRLAHRLSLSMAPSSRAKCGRFFKKCLDFLDEQDPLVLRASAHEQFARLILICYEELDLTSEYIPLEYEARVTDVEDESSDFPTGLSESVLDDMSHSEVAEEDTSGKIKIFSRNQGRHFCQSDRASSSNNASSSSGPVRPQAYGRRSVKRTNGRLEVENANGREGGYSDMRKSDSHVQTSKTKVDKTRETITTLATNFGGLYGGKETFEGKSGGIFKFLNGPTVGDLDYNLPAAVTCYNEAIKMLSKLRADSTELFSVVKKKGWACNELGRNRLERKMLDKAELAITDAIAAFREVSDHTNIILINCNLGHGRRALAEEMVCKMGNLKTPVFFQKAYNQALEKAKLEYCESLKYYCAARLLAREDISAEVCENGSHDRRARKELRKHANSTNDAIREALSMYESLGDLWKQEATCAYFQLGCYHRDCCLKFLHDFESSRIENILQRVKQYASLAERNWQNSIDFYDPKTHPVMYLTILIEQSALVQKLSDSFHLNTMIESALCHLLEGCLVLGELSANSLSNDESKVTARLRTQLQVGIDIYFENVGGVYNLFNTRALRALGSNTLKKVTYISVTLDPKVTGNLIFCIDIATRLVNSQLKGLRKSVCIARLHSAVPVVAKVSRTLEMLTGVVFQLPLLIYVVKRQLHIITIYESNLMEFDVDKHVVVFWISFEAGERFDSLHSNRTIHRGMKLQNILTGAGCIVKENPLILGASESYTTLGTGRPSVGGNVTERSSSNKKTIPKK